MPSMNLSRRLAVALTTFLAAAAVQAQSNPGPDNQTTLTVRANVAAKCRIVSPAGFVFLAIDSAATGPIRSSPTNVVFHCTKGTPFDIYVNSQRASGTVPGLTLKQTAAQGAGAADTIGYSLSTRTTGTTGAGFGAASALELVLSASVSPDQYANATAGDYEDTVTVEIRP